MRSHLLRTGIFVTEFLSWLWIESGRDAGGRCNFASS